MYLTWCQNVSVSFDSAREARPLDALDSRLIVILIIVDSGKMMSLALRFPPSDNRHNKRNIKDFLRNVCPVGMSWLRKEIVILSVMKQHI